MPRNSECPFHVATLCQSSPKLKSPDSRPRGIFPTTFLPSADFSWRTQRGILLPAEQLSQRVRSVKCATWWYMLTKNLIDRTTTSRLLVRLRSNPNAAISANYQVSAGDSNPVIRARISGEGRGLVSSRKGKGVHLFHIFLRHILRVANLYWIFTA